MGLETRPEAGRGGGRLPFPEQPALLGDAEPRSSLLAQALGSEDGTDRGDAGFEALIDQHVIVLRPAGGVRGDLGQAMFCACPGCRRRAQARPASPVANSRAAPGSGTTSIAARAKSELFGVRARKETEVTPPFPTAMLA